MSKFKIRESYLLLLIVLGLESLGIYTTYALFTASITINDVVGITATLDIGKSLTEYEVVTVQPNETKLIELNVVNSYNGNIYYGAWYQIVKGNSDNIQIGLYTERNSNPGSGSLSSSSNINLLVGITNDNSTPVTLYIGVKGSLTNELNLGTNKILIPDGFTEPLSVTVNITNGTINNSTTSTIKVKKGNNAIFNVTPNDGYQLDIDTQTCNGALNRDTGVFTISNIIENKECSLTLKRNNLDTSGANTPDLVDGLIPVMYDGSKWVKADESNSNSTYQWYDYDNKLWANAVLVTSTNRSTYQSATPGTTISTSDILAYYVWIPRYKYKVWNIYKAVGIDIYDAYNTGIDIVFENEKESTGTISCNYDFSNTNESTLSETCTGTYGDYYTHPAFTFGSDELRGFWSGKFEITGSSTKLTILPNVNSLRNDILSNLNTLIQNMQISGNIYGLNTSRLIADSHMITNMEWGAVAYLTNSKYGRCTNNSCVTVTLNNCSYYITGIGADSVSEIQSETTCSTAANKYNGAKGMLASTTGNITGIYDMSGGAYDYVMGNVSSASGSYVFYPSGSNFSSDWYTINEAKYLTTYAYGTDSATQKAYNRSRLGDATGEVVLSTGSFNAIGGWYNGMTSFPRSWWSWFTRGGMFNGGYNSGSIFNFNLDSGSAYSDADYSTHAVLVTLK